MNNFAKKVILYSESGYADEHDSLLNRLIDAKVLLFCAVGKDCELWHDIMDELIVGDGKIETQVQMVTTWHDDETLEEVVEFAKMFDIASSDEERVQVIEI